MEINKQKLPTSVKEKSLNGIIEKKQETLSKAKRIIWSVLALVILSAFFAVFLVFDSKQTQRKPADRYY